VEDPFVKDPFVPEPSSLRREDEMMRRHLPPHQRRRHERNIKKRQTREESRRIIQESARQDAAQYETTSHEQRARLKSEFTQQARTEPPKTAAKTRRRLPVWLKRLFCLIGIIFVGLLGFAAFTAPQFEIKSVSITGAEVTPETQLRPLITKLIRQNLLRANRYSVEKAVEALPTVASAHVARLPVWPPRVQLQITERQPVLMAGAGNNWWIIDKTGLPFRRATEEDSYLYQVVAPEFAPRLGKKLDAKVWARAAALNAALQKDNRIASGQDTSGRNLDESEETIPQGSQGAYWQLRRIYFDKDGLASLRLTGKGALAKHNEMLLRLGDDHWSEKLERARVALGYFERTGRQAVELDLVSLERPVWRPIPAQLAIDSEQESGGESTG
jgi:cell division septal protein FtsQ